MLLDLFTQVFGKKKLQKNLFRRDVLNVPHYTVFVYLSFDRRF